LAVQVGVAADALKGYDWTDHTKRRNRRLILDHLPVAALDEAAEARFRRWLAKGVLARRCLPELHPVSLGTDLSSRGPT
jgi:hypothetical protein